MLNSFLRVKFLRQKLLPQAEVFASLGGWGQDVNWTGLWKVVYSVLQIKTVFCVVSCVRQHGRKGYLNEKPTKQ